MAGRINRLRNFVGTMAFACAFTTFLAAGAVGSFWEARAPHSPDPAHGVVQNMAGNSGRFYTEFQSTATALALWTFGIGILAALLITPRQSGAGILRFVGTRPNDPDRVGRWGGAAGFLLALVGVFVIGAPLVRWLNAMGVVLHA